MQYLPSVLAVLAAYLIGSLSFAVIVSRGMGLEDPRRYGSGNPGATNVLRSGNRLAAVLTLAFCYRNWRVASTLIGVTTQAQLDEDIDARNTELSSELLAAIDRIRWEMRDPAQ